MQNDLGNYLNYGTFDLANTRTFGELVTNAILQ